MQAGACLPPPIFNDLFVHQLVCLCSRGPTSRKQSSSHKSSVVPGGFSVLCCQEGTGAQPGSRGHVRGHVRAGDSSVAALCPHQACAPGRCQRQGYELGFQTGEQQLYLKPRKIIVIKIHGAVKCIREPPTQTLERGAVLSCTL